MSNTSGIKRSIYEGGTSSRYDRWMRDCHQHQPRNHVSGDRRRMETLEMECRLTLPLTSRIATIRQLFSGRIIGDELT